MHFANVTCAVGCSWSIWIYIQHRRWSERARQAPAMTFITSLISIEATSLPLVFSNNSSFNRSASEIPDCFRATFFARVSRELDASILHSPHICICAKTPELLSSLETQSHCSLQAQPHQPAPAPPLANRYHVRPQCAATGAHVYHLLPARLHRTLRLRSCSTLLDEDQHASCAATMHTATLLSAIPPRACHPLRLHDRCVHLHRQPYVILLAATHMERLLCAAQDAPPRQPSHLRYQRHRRRLRWPAGFHWRGIRRVASCIDRT
jgi:hypothetical protein